MKKVNDVLMSICEIAIIAFIPIITVITFVQVMLRYVFRAPLLWPEEFTRYLLIWITAFGSAYGVRKGMHVSFSFVFERTPPKVKPYVAFGAYTFSLVFFVVCIFYGSKFALANMIQASPALRVPMAIPLSAVPIGFAIMTMFALESLTKEIRRLLGKKS